MIGIVGDTSAGAARPTRSGRRTDLVPRQRTTGAHIDRLAQPIGAASAVAMIVLIADPARDSRERLATGLISGGATQVIQADTVNAVDALIEDSSGGHLALVSLGFGAAAPRLIDGLCRVPWTRVVVLALSAQPEPLLGALAAGATGVLRGHPGGSNPDLLARLGRLTTRELEVLSLVADGRPNKWIAEQLSLSALTVKSHLSRISRKLGTGDRSHQVAIAMRAGMLR